MHGLEKGKRGRLLREKIHQKNPKKRRSKKSTQRPGILGKRGKKTNCLSKTAGVGVKKTKKTISGCAGQQT